VDQLFQEAQADAGCHRKNALTLKKHLKTRPAADVYADVVQCLNKLLAVKKRERCVDLSLEFLTGALPLLEQGTQSASPSEVGDGEGGCQG